MQLIKNIHAPHLSDFIKDLQKIIGPNGPIFLIALQFNPSKSKLNGAFQQKPNVATLHS